MISRFSYILLVVILFVTIVVNAQVDKVLQPVEVHPPNPGGAPVQKKESDQQLAAQYFRNRDFEKAVILYKKLYEEQNSSVFYTYYLYCLVELDDFKEAERLVKKQIKSDPNGLKYQVDLGYVYAEEGDQGKSRRQFESILKDIPANRQKIIELSNAFLYRQQTEYAIETYKKGSKLLDYPFYLELGNLFRQTRNYSAMIDAYLDMVDYDYLNIATIQSRLQSALNDDPDGSVNEYLRYSLLERVQKDPQKVYFSEMLLWLSIQNEDYNLAFTQAKAIDRRMKEDGARIYDLANICMSNEAYDVAMEAFRYILKKGKDNYLYVDARIGLLYAHYLKVTNTHTFTENDLMDLEREYKETLDEYGRNASTIVIMQYLGHLQAFYLDKTDEAIANLNQAIQMVGANPRDLAASKVELADIYVLTGDVWEAKLLYAQVEKDFKNDPIGYDARFKNAKLSFYIGEYNWAKAQLDVLKAATSKLIANDALRLSVLISDNLDADSSTTALNLYAKADLLLYQHKEAEALVTLDSIFELATYHPIFDEVLLKKAEIRISQQRFEDAATLLAKIVNDYPYDITADNALFMLAELNENQFNDPDRAMALYEQLLSDYPGSLYAVDARKRFRILRGDFNKKTLTDEERFLFNLEPN
ncbi:MAG: tetratricopeptide repeat protein [Bacteroidetes bacterium]|nr:tetratricopeptide repeat protein [Bacteroidota bacterium]